MYRFFEPVTRPLLDEMQPRVVVEVGSDKGFQTELLAGWCAENGATLHCVDPLPKFDVDEWSSRWGETVVFHLELSLNALPALGAVDFACIDGDHNWYTVYHELDTLQSMAEAAGKPFPVVLLHDVGWPYGRRDLYYDPETIPGWFRHPHRRGGLSPDSREPLESGFNDHLENAIHEGTPRNGVLTAVEDFIKESSRELSFHVFPGIHGLGLLLERSSRDELDAVRERVAGEQGLRRILEHTEQDRISRLLEVSTLKRRLEKQKEASVGIRTRQKELEDENRATREEVSRLRSELSAIKEEMQTIQRESDSARLEARRQVHVTRQAADERILKLELQNQEHLAEKEAELQSERRKARKLQARLTRLRSRRSVRLSLSVARLFRPLFRMKRRASRAKSRRSLGARESSSGGRSGKDARLETRRADRAALGVQRSGTTVKTAGSGPFYDEIRMLARSGAPRSFIEAWDDEERILSKRNHLSEGPLVSVIMPTYNRASVVSEAITTVLKQTYSNWELLVCDDGSEDATADVVSAFDDDRVIYHRLDWGGAARARNIGLRRSRGEFIAYLDSDNLWHPRFLEVLVGALLESPGQHLAYSRYVDILVSDSKRKLKKHSDLPFDYDRLSEKNFIDLNTVVHRRELYETLGGFDEDLTRQQDWDLLLRYAYTRDPLYVDRSLVIYRRSASWGQITRIHRDDMSSVATIQSRVADYYRLGLPTRRRKHRPKVTVVSWDVCRNHFSKAYNLAEVLDGFAATQLLGFRFFDEPMFPPYADATPEFDTTYLQGEHFPAWSSEFAKAVALAAGDVIYAVKPRLPSLGVALLANYHFGTPVVVETNDLESVVTTPESDTRTEPVEIAEVDPNDPELLNPYGRLWTGMMEDLALRVPLRATHNGNLDAHFGGGAFLVRNLKDDRYFNPSLYDRKAIRDRLGFGQDDRVILFGGMVRKHKGVFKFAELLETSGPNLHVLVVGSRETPDQLRLREKVGDRFHVLDPVDRNAMAEINLASDAVVLWLDPDVQASHYQMPFKLTDALAMQVPVIANDIGDLGTLGRDGYLRLVPYGDLSALKIELERLKEDPTIREMTARGRRLYLRQFSYSGARPGLEMLIDRAASARGTLPVAEEFVEFFARFRDALPSDAGMRRDMSA